jgi:hypothetical protein
MPRPCLVCTHPDRNAIETLICTGASDYDVGRRFDLERVSIGRHRRLHLIKPAQDRLAILARDSAERQRRQELATTAASADGPSPAEFVEAFFGLKAQAEKLQRIEDRLERMASLAEDNQSPNGVAQVAAQQLRSVEVGAKVAGVGGYGAQRGTEPGSGQTFSINILFSSGEQVSITPAPGSHINGEEDPEADRAI